MVGTVQKGTNSPRYEQFKVRIVREPAGTSGKEGRQDEHLSRAPRTLAPPVRHWGLVRLATLSERTAGSSRTNHGEDYKSPWDCRSDSLLRSLLCTTASRPKTRSLALFLVGGELLICGSIRQRNIKNRVQDYRKTSDTSRVSNRNPVSNTSRVSSRPTSWVSIWCQLMTQMVVLSWE